MISCKRRLTKPIMEEVAEIPCLCARWTNVKNFSCSRRNVPNQSQDQNCEIISTKNYNAKVIKKTFTQTNKILSILFLLLFFSTFLITTINAGQPEHLCGARIIDALRFICGTRGIYNPSRKRGHLRAHSGNNMSITRLCCEDGCTFEQLERYCASPSAGSSTPKLRKVFVRNHRNRNGPPLPPSLKTKNFPLSRLATAPSTTIARIGSTVAYIRTKKARKSLTELEKQYKHLVSQQRRRNRKEVDSQSRRSGVLREIVDVAAEISNLLDKDDIEYTDYTSKSRFITVSLRDGLSARKP